MPLTAAAATRAVALSLLAAASAVVLAVAFHVVTPEVLHFSESTPPAPGSVITGSELREGELLAQQQLKVAMQSTPRLTESPLVSTAMGRFPWVIVLAQMGLLVLLHRATLAERSLAVAPFIFLAALAGGSGLLVAVVVSPVLLHIAFKTQYAVRKT
jgi:hypothetical protein